MGKLPAQLQPKTSAVAYYRVSTQRQGRSGLGLEAQRETVTRYCASAGLALAGEYTEIESGRKRSRAQLQAAIAEAQRTNSRLVIAKLDRLARDAAFTMSLRDSGVDFVACDMPDANTFTIGIMASFAQFEAERISTRTREALKAAKARGVKLGTPANLTPAAQAKAAKANHARAIEAYKGLANYVRMLKDGGASFERIASQLNQDGHHTRNGKPFTAMAVWRMLKRAE